MMEWWHKYFDFFVEPLEDLFPQPVTFYRPDNKEGLFAKRTLPLGYWLGHVAGWVVIAAVVVTAWRVFT